MLDELKAEVECLQESLNANPAYNYTWQDSYIKGKGTDNPQIMFRTVRLIDFVPRNGESKGEIQRLTQNQYRAMMSREPRACILTPDGHVKWEYALDEIAQELGYEKLAGDSKYQADELLRQDIERGYRERLQLNNLKQEIKECQERSTMPDTGEKPQNPTKRPTRPAWDEVKAHERAKQFEVELDAILKDGNKATDLIALWPRYYLVTGHKLLGRTLIKLAKGVK